MKKFIICACALVVLGFSCWYAYYYMGVYLDLDPDAPVTTFMKADESTIYMARDGEYVPFEIRGVDMGVGIPGSGPPTSRLIRRPICDGFRISMIWGPTPFGYTPSSMTTSTTPFMNTIYNGRSAGRNRCGCSTGSGWTTIPITLTKIFTTRDCCLR